MRQERLFRTEGIVLRQRDYGEADRILTLLTPGGKITALAKGIRRATSRKAGHLELFAHSQLMLARGRNFYIITQAESLESLEPLREDLLRFTYACYAAELVDSFIQEGEESSEPYGLLLQALHWFAQERDLRLWMRYFELRLLRFSGYQPELFTCVRCLAPLQAVENFFSAELGGVLCHRCGTQEPSAKALSVNAHKVLRYLSTRSAAEVRNLRLREGTHAEVEALLQHYIEYILERELKSVAFLRRLRRELRALERERSLKGPSPSNPGARI